MDDRMARFIMDEVVPEVCKRTTANGDRIVISARAEDHAIMGGSSGGITSFNAAFQRPDLFVISGGRLFVRRLLRPGVADAFSTPAPKSEGQG